MSLNQKSDPNYKYPLAKSIPLGIQHVLAMFAGNITVPIIIAGVAGLSGGDKIFLIQAAMIIAGISTLIQSVGVGPIGARLPIVQGTSFAFIPIMIPIIKSLGLAAVFGATIVAGLFHFIIGLFIGKLRRFLPPLTTGLVVLAIGLALMPTGIKYAAGGAHIPDDFGALHHWILSLSVIITTVLIKVFFRNFASALAILIGLIVGYVIAIFMGMVDFSKISGAGWFDYPTISKFGIEFHFTAILAMCLMSIVSAVETVGDISGITKGGANREATDKEISGGTMADGVGTFIAGFFGAFPNTSYSQNVGLISLTGVMSRHVVTIGALFLIAAGFIPKLGGFVASIPNAVIGGAAVLMFGMIASAGLKLLFDTVLNTRNMTIIALSLTFGLGLQSVPKAMQLIPSDIQFLFTSGLLPVAFISITLNAILPKEMD